MNKYIKNLNAYTPPLSGEGFLKLHMNENLYGPSPNCLKVLENIKEEDLMFYPFDDNRFLENKIAEFAKVTSENIISYNGSSTCIQNVIKVLFNIKDTVLIPDPSWNYYETVISSNGCTSKKYKLKINKKEIVYDLEEIRCKIKLLKAKGVLIASPNMPTGNTIENSKIIELAKEFENTYFLIDQAYAEFGNNFLSAKEAIKYKNIILIRTFSKFYALAGIRCGYIITNPSIALQLRKVSPLFGNSFISQLISVAALKDIAYYKKLKENIKVVKNDFIKLIRKLKNFYAYPSSANFILIRINNSKISIDSVLSLLKENKVLVKNCSSYNLKTYIRVSIGLPEQMQKLFKILKDYDVSV